MDDMKKIKTQDKNSNCMSHYYRSNTFHMKHISSLNITLEKVMRLEMSSVTLLSLKGALQEVLLILLRMLIKQL